MNTVHTLPAGETDIMHDNEVVFPDPHFFKPERWLEETSGEESIFNQSLEKYLVAFGHGTRNCLGCNFGSSMLYLNLAAVISQFDIHLFETGEGDVKS